MREKIFNNLSLQCADLLESGEVGEGPERKRVIYDI